MSASEASRPSSWYQKKNSQLLRHGTDQLSTTSWTERLGRMTWLTPSTRGRATPAEMSSSDVPRRYQCFDRGSPRQQRGADLAPFGRSDHNLSQRRYLGRNHEGDRPQVSYRCPRSRIADSVAGAAEA